MLSIISSFNDTLGFSLQMVRMNVLTDADYQLSMDDLPVDMASFRKRR
jgi:hypothetical protein